jgi:hypothetical protein
MLRVTGRLYASLDGLGTSSGTGTIQVDKPSAGAKVVGAYLTVANLWGSTTTPTGYQLAGQNVTFTHTASNSNSKNYLADVTSLIKTSVDSASAGNIDISVDEGANNNSIDGSSLLVIFDDPDSLWGSLIFMFGVADPSGDTFGAAFPALGANELNGHWMSLAISFGFQATNLGQSSEISITTSANATPAYLTKVAGGSDDGEAANGALVTIGGIGDSTANNPGTSTTFVSPERTDDELYSLDQYLLAGDTELTLSTINPSNNDNIWQAVFFLSRVQVANAVVVDDPQVTASIGAPNIANVGSTPAAQPETRGDTSYRGPMPTSFYPASAAADTEVEIAGKRLELVSSVLIDDVLVPIISQTSRSMIIKIPAGLASGVKNVVFLGWGTLTYQSALRLVDSPPLTSSVEAEQKFQIEVLNNAVQITVFDCIGQTVSAKVAGKWIKIDISEPKQVIYRKTIWTDFDILVHLYLDGSHVLSESIKTK